MTYLHRPVELAGSAPDHRNSWWLESSHLGPGRTDRLGDPLVNGPGRGGRALLLTLGTFPNFFQSQFRPLDNGNNLCYILHDICGDESAQCPEL